MPCVWTRTTKQLAELGSLAVFLSEVSSVDGSFQEAVLYDRLFCVPRPAPKETLPFFEYLNAINFAKPY